MFTWIKRLRCKHERTIIMHNGECINACKHCKKPMEVKQREQ